MSVVRLLWQLVHSGKLTAMKRLLGVFGSALPALLIGGCLKSHPGAPLATDIDPKLATPEYWYARPATVTVSSNDFNALWEACERTARNRFFEIDRRDFRAGVLATKPMVSKQFWELWRKDVGTFKDSREATLGTIRRTILFQFNRESSGGYTVVPKVLVERQAHIEAKYMIDPNFIAPAYWYAIRRDTALELKLAASVREKLRIAAPAASVAAAAR